jgi:hypothetical protein
VSVSSFLPIIIVGPISDLVGTATVLLIVAVGVLIVGVASVFLRDPHLGVEGATADPHAVDPIAAALGADLPTWRAEIGVPSSPIERSSGEQAIIEQTGPADPADRD